MSRPSQDGGNVYRCKTCRGRFVIPAGETAVCCPICRMNRVEEQE